MRRAPLDSHLKKSSSSASSSTSQPASAPGVLGTWTTAWAANSPSRSPSSDSSSQRSLPSYPRKKSGSGSRAFSSAYLPDQTNRPAGRSWGVLSPKTKKPNFTASMPSREKPPHFSVPSSWASSTQASGSQRYGMATVGLFFIVGGLLLRTVDEQKGIRMAREKTPSETDA